MSTSPDTLREHLTLTEAALAACRPVAGEGGHVLRAFCPFHSSDHQRSLRVTLANGRFQCFACGAWGYLEEARQRWREEQQRQAALRRPLALQRRVPSSRPATPPAAVSRPAPGRTWRRSLPPSRPPCRGAAARRIYTSAAFPWRWRSGWAWAMRRRGPGRTRRATGAAAASSFRTPRRTAVW